MAKSQQSFSKKEKEKKRLKKRLDKQKKQEERKANKGSGPDDMIAYVDEYGNITDAPPDPTKKKKVKASSIEVSIPRKEKVELDPIRKGKVDFYDTSKGFGFIYDSETQDKYFFHVKGLIDEVQESDKVSFELEQGMKGLNAVRVKRI